jgi:membrane protein YqaA with SNARE-associated domain
MDFTSWFAPDQVYLASFVVSFVSGFVPIVNTEAYLLSVSALSSVPAVPVILLSTLGQMCSKLILYLGGRGLVRLPLGRPGQSLDKMRAELERRQGKTDALIFASAFLGFPPFYAVTLVAGVVQVPVLDFLLPSTLGRLLRFAAVFAFPQLVKRLAPMF